MNKFWKKVVGAFMCVCMVTPAAACGNGGEEGGQKAVNTSAARAAQLADNVFNKYIDRELYEMDRDDTAWELSVFDGYSHEAGTGDGGASVWHYTSVYALSNRMYALYKDGGKGEEYKKLMSDLFDELAWYRGTGTFVEFTGTSERTVYGVNRSNRGRNKAGEIGRASCRERV